MSMLMMKSDNRLTSGYSSGVAFNSMNSEGICMKTTKHVTGLLKTAWNKGDIDAVVYDNVLDQEIGGGQIVIHTGGKKN